MTGLEPETDRILEIAMIVTDKELNILAEGPVLAIHQSDEVLQPLQDLFLSLVQVHSVYLYQQRMLSQVQSVVLGLSEILEEFIGILHYLL